MRRSYNNRCFVVLNIHIVHNFLEMDPHFETVTDLFQFRSLPNICRNLPNDHKKDVWALKKGNSKFLRNVIHLIYVLDLDIM